MMVIRYCERLCSEIQDKLAVFDFITIVAISSKAQRVEQALLQRTGRCFGNQAWESFYKKGPDSTFNRTPQQGFLPPPGLAQNQIQRQQQAPPQGEQNPQHN